MKGRCIHNLISYFIIISYNISSWPHVIYHIHLYHIMNLIFQLVELASILIVFTVMYFLSLSLCWYDLPRTLRFFLTWFDFNFNLTFQTRNKHINSVYWLRAYLQHSKNLKHRKNCKCCPGHYLIVNHYSSMSWSKFRNLSEMVNCVTNSLNHS